MNQWAPGVYPFNPFLRVFSFFLFCYYFICTIRYRNFCCLEETRGGINRPSTCVYLAAVRKHLPLGRAHSTWAGPGKVVGVGDGLGRDGATFLIP